MGQSRTYSSPYYSSLDGLRGVAAIAVVLLHRGEWFHLGGWLEHGYLAVDFFFMLSGFVIASAYEARLRDGLPLAAFVRARVIRLYPLILLGVAIGAAWRLALPAFGADAAPPADIGVLFLRGVATIPTLAPNGVGAGIFPLDGPTWSLFFEVLANLAYVVLLPWLTTRRLAVVVLLSAAALAVAALQNGGVEMGATPATFWGGFARTAFPFAAGVLLFRLRDRPALAWPPVPVAAQAMLLLVAFNLPALPGAAGAALDLACVGLAFPALLALSIRSRPAGRATDSACRWLGELSYPLYILHYPLYVLIGGYAWQRGWLDKGSMLTVGLISLAAILVVSQAALVFYDKPVRRWLGGLRRASTRAPAVAVAPAGE